MKVLIAEDDPVNRRKLEFMLSKWGYEVVVTCDGDAAWQLLQSEGAPALAILDVMMPGMNGTEVCERVRKLPDAALTYIILLTANNSKEDIVQGLRTGANDYITKPFDREELQARVQVGARVVELQRLLADRVRELEDALSRVKQLQGLLPMCSYCKSIRDDQDYWQRVENYIAEHSGAKLSHSICPTCYKHFIEPELERLRQMNAHP